MSAVICLRMTSGLRLGLVRQLTTVSSGPICWRSINGTTELCTAFSKPRRLSEVRQSRYLHGRGLHDVSGCQIAGIRHLSSSEHSPSSEHSHSVHKNSSKSSKQEPEVGKKDDDVKEPQDVKLTVVQKLKKMFKEYWYVLLPVHISTSVVWLGSFYYIAKSGFDIVPLLEYVGTSETILKPLRSTGAGYWAVTYALYKLVTPARYAVTLGGTTIAINYLARWGLIKPMPFTGQMTTMFRPKSARLKKPFANEDAKSNRASKAKPDSSET